MEPSLRKRFFAWTLKKGEEHNFKLYNAYKKDLFTNIKGVVVEIGPGTGVNFPYLEPGVEWIGIEPNEAFHTMLLDKAGERKINARLLTGDASDIPLGNESADVILCTLVLCSVADQDKAVAEMKRILKPGGKLLFIEHVAAPKQSILRFIQDISNPFNRLMADGCHCNRETWKAIEAGRFQKVDIAHKKVNSALRLHSPHIMGFAVK